MNRTRLNSVVDIAAFALATAIAVTGLILRYMLPPGSGRFGEIGLGGFGAGRPVTVLWGLSRHEWGDIHFWLSVAILIVLAFHLVLHWRWISAVVRGRAGNASGFRFATGIVALLALIALSAAPFLSSPQKVPRGVRSSGEPLSGTLTRAAAPETSTTHAITGSMTLADIEKKTGVPVQYIITRLKLPPETRPDEQVGRLRRQYGFNMDDLRRYVREYREEATTEIILPQL